MIFERGHAKQLRPLIGKAEPLLTYSYSLMEVVNIATGINAQRT